MRPIHSGGRVAGSLAPFAAPGPGWHLGLVCVAQRKFFFFFSAPLLPPAVSGSLWFNEAMHGVMC